MSSQIIKVSPPAVVAAPRGAAWAASAALWLARAVAARPSTCVRMALKGVS